MGATTGVGTGVGVIVRGAARGSILASAEVNHGLRGAACVGIEAGGAGGETSFPISFLVFSIRVQLELKEVGLVGALSSHDTLTGLSILSPFCEVEEGESSFVGVESADSEL